MTGMCNMAAVHRTGWLFRWRLTSPCDVKAALAAGRNHNTQLMRGGRA
jgi:hypothetical protein